MRIYIPGHIPNKVLEYGVRTPVFYGNLREQTREDLFPRTYTESLFGSYTIDCLTISGNLRKLTRDCDLGVL